MEYCLQQHIQKVLDDQQIGWKIQEDAKVQWSDENPRES